MRAVPAWWICKVLPKPRRISTTLECDSYKPFDQCNRAFPTEKAMARNFGVPRQFNGQTRAPVWPLWMIAFMAVVVINAATFLPH
jgi:hypothetical protein